MKKIFLIVAFIFSCFLFQDIGAQLRVSINGNIGSQPVWGPTGYDYASYYYLPDIDMFYYIPKRQYIYQEQGGWIFSTALPTRYSTYDLYSGYKVVVNDIRPYQHVEIYRIKYASFKGRHDQEVIRNSHEPKYFRIKNHPEHNKWKSKQGRRR